MTMREALEGIAQHVHELCCRVTADNPLKDRIHAARDYLAALTPADGDPEYMEGCRDGLCDDNPNFPSQATQKGLEQQNFDLIDEAALAAQRMRGLEDALRDLLDAVEASNKVKARDFYHERKRARAFVPKTK